MQNVLGTDIVEVNYGDKTLYFNPIDHSYHLDSLRLFSVTTYLKEAGYTAQYRGDGSKATFGSYVHDATAYLDAGDLDMESLDPEIARRVEQYKKFKAEHDFVPDMKWREKPCYHPDYLYAGTMDLAGMMDGKPVIIDIKTGRKEKWHQLQVGGGYKPMLGAHDPRYENAEPFSLYLWDEEYELDEADDNLEPLFAHIVSAMNGRELYGRKMR